MLKSSALLTSAVLLLIEAAATAAPLDAEDSSMIRLSGFASSTAFSSSAWQPDLTTAAVNFDLTGSEWAVRGQAATPYEQPIRRLVLERSASLGSGREIVLQAGRFPRSDSFFNSVTDAPSSWGIATLPQGQYNRRLIGNRTFTSVEGAQAIYTMAIGDDVLKLHADIGRTVVEKQCETQVEATKMPCRSSYEILGAPGSLDIGATYSSGNWTTLAYYGRLRALTNLLNPKDRTAVALTRSASKILYDSTKIGVRYADEGWYVQSEIVRNTFNISNLARVWTQKQASWNAYVLGGRCLRPDLCLYTSYSYGHSSTPGGGAVDRVVGATHTVNALTLSVEYHKGRGKAWERYFATDDRWNSWAASAAWSF
jgi:hypothetical protein